MSLHMSATKDVRTAKFALMAALHRAELGQRIRERREALGLSQQELADEVGVRWARTIARWEGGQSFPQDDNLERLPGALKMTSDELVGDLSNEDFPPPTRETDPQIDQLRESLEQQNAQLRKQVASVQKDVAQIKTALQALTPGNHAQGQGRSAADQFGQDIAGAIQGDQRSDELLEEKQQPKQGRSS